MIRISTKGKELFKDGCVDGYYNNVKMEMLDGSGIVITNNNIIGESLRMTERACSGDTLKFGVCEAKSLEIECFDIPNIKGKRFFLSIEKIKEDTGKVIDTVKYGEFLVDSCKKQPFDGRRKIIAYDDLRSTTLDKDMAEIVNASMDNTEDFVQPCVFQIEKDLLQKFGINNKEKENLRVEWETSTTGENTHRPDDDSGYYVVAKSRYLDCSLNQLDYYVFNIPDDLQEEREAKVRSILKSYRMTFSGSASFWLDQLCYIRIKNENGNEKSYVGRNGDKQEYTNISTVTLFVAEEIIIKSPSDQDSYKISFGYDDVIENVSILKLDLTTMEKVRMKEKVQNVTLRNILASVYELKAEFGRMNRETGLLESVPLNTGTLYPKDTLYPANTLYPFGGGSAEKDIIESVWVDERGGVIYGKLKINYVKIGEDGNKEEAVHEYVFDKEHNKTYEVNDNWILQNIVMTDEEIAEIAAEMGEGMKGVEVTPFEAEMIGLPYLEAGDMIEIPDGEGEEKRRVYVLERTISGIQGMKDSIEALGGGI